MSSKLRSMIRTETCELWRAPVCDPVVGAALIGAGTSLYASSRMPKPPKPTPAVMPQQPDEVKRKKQGGYNDTILTGPQGLAAGSQNLGASTLLGG